jgi:hypothetical protein
LGAVFLSEPIYMLNKTFCRVYYSDHSESYIHVNIYFGKLTMDVITYDMKTNFQTKISTIGTMGLFTGFSILNGIEIIYHLLEFIIKIFKTKVIKQF